MMHTLIALTLALSSMQPAPQARTATSQDGTKIVYDVTGSGPVVMLLHGLNMNRQPWHREGYVERLAKEFTVVTMDLRGFGESDKPAAVSAYHIERINEDILAVADAVKAQRFSIWGFSYGANLGRYLASRSTRVASMVYIGYPFGLSINEVETGLIRKDPEAPALFRAAIDYPPVEPSDMRCPTLWVVGTKSEFAYASAKQYENTLAGTPVTLAMFDGLSHSQEFESNAKVFARELEFTRAHVR